MELNTQKYIKLNWFLFIHLKKFIFWQNSIFKKNNIFCYFNVNV